MEYVTQCGQKVPKVGLGTWQVDESTVYEAVRTALDLGYRHIDTAQLYRNEAGVGRAIADSDVEREDIFLTTKVNPMHRTVRDILGSVDRSREKLQVDAIDLLLIHWPNPLANLETVMRGLDACVNEELTRYIGVSNFSRDRLKKAQKLAKEPIFTNQVLFHPWWPQRELLRYCQNNDVLLTAYSPLANGGALSDDLLEEIGNKYGKTGPQVALRWATQHENVITIPQSTSRQHQSQNLETFDFTLTQAEHDRITRPSYLKTGLAMAQGKLNVPGVL